MPEGLVLGSAADLVGGGVAQPHHMEGVRDLAGIRQRGVERGPVWPRQVQHPPADLLQPSAGTRQQPLGGRLGAAAWHYVKQLAPACVDDAGGPGLGPEPAAAPQQDLVEAQRAHIADPFGVGIDQRLTPAAHRDVHRMPAAPQLFGDAAVGLPSARPARRPAPRFCGQLLARRRDIGVLLGDGPRPTARLTATPPALVPHQPRRPPERTQIHQLDPAHAMGPQQPATAHTGRPRRPPTDMHPQQRARPVADAELLDIAQSHQQLTDTRRVALHRDPPGSRLPVNADSGGSLAFSRGQPPPSPHPQTRRVGSLSRDRACGSVRPRLRDLSGGLHRRDRACGSVRRDWRAGTRERAVAAQAAAAQVRPARPSSDRVRAAAGDGATRPRRRQPR